MDSSVKENILKELTNLEKKCDEIKEIPDILEKFLINVSDSGDIVFKWEQFKPLIKKKIELIAAKFNQTYPYNANSINQPNVRPFDFEEIKRNILNGIDSFTNAPFTIQRICELLTDPYRHYKRADKFMKGLEKNVMVISEEIVDQLTENGNTSTSSSCLNSTFTLPSTSDSISQLNGYKEIEPENLLPHNQQTPTIQQLDRQLDSFTAVFVSSTQIQQNPLERIANLPILESTTISCLASSSSTAPISQAHLISPLSNSTTTLENLDKVSTEPQSQAIHQSIEKQQEHLLETELPQQEQLMSTKTDEIIETVNIKEQIHSFENSPNGQQEAIETLDQESSKKDKKEESNSSNNELLKEVKKIDDLNDQTTQLVEENEPNKQNETIEKRQFEEDVNLVTKIEESFKSPNKVNELKRVCDSPDIEPIKRFKSDLDEQAVEIRELNQEETDQKKVNEKSIYEENSDNDKQSEENSNNEEKELKNVDKQPELVDNQPKDQQVTNTDQEINKTEKFTNQSNEADNLEKPKENETELLQNGNNQQKDTLPANELFSEEKPEEINKDLTVTN